MFGSSLFLTIYALSLVRLEISLSPFRFQAHNHAHLATLLLTVGCLAYRRHRRTKRTYQLSGGNEQQQQLPATTTTRF